MIFKMKLRTGEDIKYFCKKIYLLRIDFYGEMKNNPEENGIYCFEIEVKEKPKNLRKYGKKVLEELTKDPLSIWKKAELKGVIIKTDHKFLDDYEFPPDDEVIPIRSTKTDKKPDFKISWNSKNKTNL